MKRPGKYLKFYKKWLKTGIVPINKNSNYGGMCGFLGKEVMSILEPTNSDAFHYETHVDKYWGSDINDMSDGNIFGPTRQNMILLLAAMNNEL